MLHSAEKLGPGKIAVAALIVLLGMYLRGMHVGDQILLDDEWHAIDYVPGKSFAFLATHFGSSANCIPLNLYRHLTLQTIGWSEFILRFPSLLAGALMLVLFPYGIRKLTAPPALLPFMGLLAISPLLVFYSRVSRAYSMVALLSFLCLLALYFMATTGQKRYAAIYIVLGGLAIYFHLFALVAVGAPLLFLWLTALSPGPGKVIFRDQPISSPRPSVFFRVGILLIGFVLLLMAPALLSSPFPMIKTIEKADWNSFAGVIQLVAGSGNPIMIGLFLLCWISGIGTAIKKNPLWAGMALSCYVAYIAVFSLIHHSEIHNPLEIIRFAIILAPLSLMFAAEGGISLLSGFCLLLKRDDPCMHYPFVGLTFTCLFCGLFFITGPLPHQLGMVNNFLNHSACQENYKTESGTFYTSKIIPCEHANLLRIPTLYKNLKNRPDIHHVVEYPMYIGNHFNPLYWYQQEHQKRVSAGYITEINHPMKSTGFVYATIFIDSPMSRGIPKEKCRFKSMVDMLDVDQLKKMEATLIILHKNYQSEVFEPCAWPQVFLHYPPELFKQGVYLPAAYLDSQYRRIFGSPEFEDENLVVFRTQ